MYVTVVKKLPYAKEVVKYDECGRPYCVTVIASKEMAVTVAKVVEVVKYVKVCG